MCCEAVADMAMPLTKSADGVTGVHDRIDDLDWDKFPCYGFFPIKKLLPKLREQKETLRIQVNGLQLKSWIVAFMRNYHG